MKHINIDKSYFFNIKNDNEINEKKIWVLDDEFNIEPNEEFCNLTIYKDLSLVKSKISLYSEIIKTYLSKASNSINLVFYEIQYGGYLLLEIMTELMNNYKDIVSKKVRIYFQGTNKEQLSCFIKNLEYYENNEWISKNIELLVLNNNLTSDITLHINPNNIQPSNKDILITKNSLNVYRGHNYFLKYQNEFLLVPNELHDTFKNEFYYFISDNEIMYRSLIHYTMIVKNAGKILEEVLLKNLEYIDQWTILDTGSTDDTVDIINKILVDKKKGNLYFSEFKDFKQSRNLCLNLAKETNYCSFFVMLDDTYVLQGPLVEFLNITRGDQFADSFSLYIQSDDTQYVSNRITKPERNLRYIYKIHEVIQQKNNKNVIVPINHGKILDLRSDYMEKRTMDRKQFDLQLLFDEYEENPNDPRALYYLGQTYNLLESYDLAYEFFLKRANHPVEGFLQEKIDAIFEAARIANFKLNKSWEECLPLYESAYNLDKTRPDSLYFIGIHYYLQNDIKRAYEYFKEGFHLGYPLHAQYSLKPTLSFHFLPKFLTQICYQMDDFKLGFEVSKFFLENNTKNDDSYDIIFSWYLIFYKLNLRTAKSETPIIQDKPIFIFVADGGFKPWTGSSIEKEGVGGSETWIIETSKYIKKLTDYHVIVFCNTPNDEVSFYKEVEYRPLNDFFNVCMNYKIEHCVISRFSEYIPTAIHSYVENIYFIMHDLGPSGLIIPIHPKIKKMLCLTEWHKSYFLEHYPQFKDITEVSNYGIDLEKFGFIDGQKVKNSFIYSSYPNRGLQQVLEMWPSIIEKYPDASLNIYSDVYNKWSNDNYPEMMKNIQELLKTLINKKMNINYFGWVDKKILSKGWSKAEYWLYPCVFMETFCLTALEAAASKTLVISNDLAALKDTVGDRGIVIKGDVINEDWKKRALDKIFYLMNSNSVSLNERNYYLQKNYEWARKTTWENQTKAFLNKFIGYRTDIDDEYKKNIDDIRENVKHIIKDNLIPIILDLKEPLEGSLFNSHMETKVSDRYLEKQYNVCDVLFKHKVNNVLEIGFNAGFSTLLMLEANKDVQITCVDICYHSYVMPCYEWISNKYPGRIRLIKGDSKDVLKSLVKNNEKFDIIHIDGGHGFDSVFYDCLNAFQLIKNGTLLIMDDYEMENIKLLWDLFSNYHGLKEYHLLKKTKEQSIRYVVN